MSNTLLLFYRLAELRKIGYSHDKWLREDSEYRHQQQMRLLSPSPSNLSVVSGSPIELNTTVELTSSTASETTEGSSNADSTGVEQSSCKYNIDYVTIFHRIPDVCALFVKN